MNSDDSQRLRALFDEAFELNQEERQSYLARTCSDPVLRAEVLSLLAAYDESAELEPFLPDAELWEELEPPHPADRFVGCDIGAYRITDEIGHGGMGTVYRAVRNDGRFEKTVAVKVIRAGMNTETILRRFEAEQRILASLDHPHITRLLDGGRTESGRPYLIMEYVEGRHIDDYCDEERLDVRERLRLFLQVCDAARYAHARLVVHRDLKPANILVFRDEKGRSIPKLLDFGVAKLLQSQESPEGMLTTSEHHPLTPAYASPEQLRGEPVSTACDVYALGVLLYRLLTGRLPYRTDELTFEAWRRVVSEGVPYKPSSVVMRAATISNGDGATMSLSPELVSVVRKTSPQALKRSLSGDLDTIVLAALQKDPDRRYGSAEQFAEDLRRYLAGRPISAHPDSFGYRGAKFVRRHRKSVVAAALLVVSLLGGMGSTIWQARIADQERSRAERRFADVRHLAGTFLFEFHDAIRDLPGSTPARELVVERALEYLDKLVVESEDDPSLQLELAEAYRRVGDVQGNPTNANLGRTQDALESYRKALDILHSSTGDESELVPALALTLEKLSDVYGIAGDLEEADASLQRAVLHYRELATSNPEDVEHQVRYVVGIIKQGDLQGNPNFPNLGRPSEADDRYLEAKSILENFHAVDSSQHRVLRLLGLIEERIGTIHVETGRHQAAREAFLRSLRIRERHAANRPFDNDAIRDLAVANEKMGIAARESNDFEEARQRHGRATATFRSLVKADSQNVQAWQSLAISRMHEGDLEADLESSDVDVGAAASSFREALGLLKEIERMDPANERTKRLAERAEEGLARSEGARNVSRQEVQQ